MFVQASSQLRNVGLGSKGEVRVVELKCRYATLITGTVYGEALQQDKQKYASYAFKRQQQKTGIACRFLFYCAIS
jgi:hypothetical protein